MLAPPAYHLCTCRRLREVAKTKSLTNTCIETVAYRCSLITMELHRCVVSIFFSKFQVEKFQNARDFFFFFSKVDTQLKSSYPFLYAMITLLYFLYPQLCNNAKQWSLKYSWTKYRGMLQTPWNSQRNTIGGTSVPRELAKQSHFEQFPPSAAQVRGAQVRPKKVTGNRLLIVRYSQIKLISDLWRTVHTI